MSGGFGTPFRPQTNQAVTAGATPPSGDSAESIWHQLYDTQSFVSATTTALQFFLSPGVDPTLSNMTQGGTLPRPQTLQIYDITLDVLSIIPLSVSATATVVGVLNDLALLIFGAGQRPTWTLSISQKAYGPYSLTVLHGTGGPTGWGWAYGTAAAESFQYARNEPGPGWNYYGRVSILEQMQFQLSVNWAATATLTEDDRRLRCVSLFGVLNRRVL